LKNISTPKGHYKSGLTSRGKNAVSSPENNSGPQESHTQQLDSYLEWPSRDSKLICTEENKTVLPAEQSSWYKPTYFRQHLPRKTSYIVSLYK